MYSPETLKKENILPQPGEVGYTASLASAEVRHRSLGAGQAAHTGGYQYRMNPRNVKLDWLVPYPIRGSGGHRTILAHVRDLVRRGYECVMHVQERDPYVPGRPTRTASELERMLRDYFFDTGARVVPTWQRLESCDVLYATLWNSAFVVRGAATARRKAYFVQDFEAWFMPMGDGYLRAESTYSLGLECTTIGRWLTHVITQQYGGNADYFDFTVDEKLYHAEPGSKTPAPSVVFLHQPEKPRRCPWLGLETLKLLKQRAPEAQIFLYGSDASADLGVPHENLGLISTPQCASLYQRAHVGLCISSTNPSRIPFEMMASGCAVVDLNRPNNHFDYEPGTIALADPTPEALAEQLVQLLTNDEQRRRQVDAALAMMAGRSSRKAFDQVEEMVVRLVETGSVRGVQDPSMPAPPASVPRRERNSVRTGPVLGSRVLGSGKRGAQRAVRFAAQHLQQHARTLQRGYGRRRRASYATLESVLASMTQGKCVIGFDVFDTLLLRRIEPDRIKELVARKLQDLAFSGGKGPGWKDLLDLRKGIEQELCIKNQRAGRDDEFAYDEMIDRWLEAAGALASERPTLAVALKEQEQAIELASHEVHATMVPILAALKQREFRLIFVSDYYLPVEALWRFLRCAGLGTFFDAGYSSSQEMLRKATGRLFRHVIDQEMVGSKELIFVGDDEHADMRRANEVGIDVVHLVDPVQKTRRMRLEILRSLAAQNPFWRGAIAHEVVTNSVHAARHNPSGAWALGWEIAPAYVAFAEHVIRKAREGGFQLVVFCAREGATFYRMARHLTHGDLNGPRMRYIGVSRRATFLPSMACLNHYELMRFLRQYRSPTPLQFIDSLGLPVDEFAPAMKRVGFGALDRPVENIADSAALAAFIADPEVQERFDAHRVASRDNLVTYLRQEGLFDATRVLLVDIGWKGSILDNLARVVGGQAGAPKLEGLLFGAQEDTPTDVCCKTAFFVWGPDRDPIAAAILGTVPLFEMFATANHGTTVSYARRGGRMRPVTEYLPEEKDTWRRTMRVGHRAVREYFASYLAVRPLLATTFDVSSDEWRPYLHERMRRLVAYPRSKEVRAFMETSHVESFGVFSVRRFRAEGPSLRDVKTPGTMVPGVDDFYRAVRHTVWPAGMLTRMGLGVLHPLYDAFDTWHRTHRW